MCCLGYQPAVTYRDATRGLQATINFYDSLRSLLNSDLSVDRALQLAGERGPQPYRRWTPRLAAACGDGRHMADALRDVGEDSFVCALIDAGEKSSRLPEMCQEIADIHRHMLLLRNDIISRSIYPLLCSMRH